MSEVEKARKNIEWTIPYPEPRTPMQRDSHDEALRNLHAFEKAVRAEQNAKFAALAREWREQSRILLSQVGDEKLISGAITETVEACAKSLEQLLKETK